mmetsp:Transcript_53331/g.104337  ORF Transcript_53331/g.104337 Transcript_53331/m.104337 type:complete len:306 (-) Transcript_53331:792-1709(-)
MHSFNAATYLLTCSPRCNHANRQQDKKSIFYSQTAPRFHSVNDKRGALINSSSLPFFFSECRVTECPTTLRAFLTVHRHIRTGRDSGGRQICRFFFVSMILFPSLFLSFFLPFLPSLFLCSKNATEGPPPGCPLCWRDGRRGDRGRASGSREHQSWGGVAAAWWGEYSRGDLRRRLKLRPAPRQTDSSDSSGCSLFRGPRAASPTLLPPFAAAAVREVSQTRNRPPQSLQAEGLLLGSVVADEMTRKGGAAWRGKTQRECPPAPPPGSGWDFCRRTETETGEQKDLPPLPLRPRRWRGRIHSHWL